MLRMKNIIYVVLAALLILSVSGCSKWLGVKPYDKIGQDDLLSSEEGFMKLLNGIYIELNSDMLYGGALSVEMLEIMGGAYSIGTDESVWGNYVDLSKFEYKTEYWRARLSETWNKAYSLILNCNLILDNIDEKKGLFSGDNFNIIKGEARALRAMLHFDMLRLFGPVYSRNPGAESIPYYMHYTTVPENLLPASEVADKITSDLMEARILLTADPVKTEGTRLDGPVDGTSPFLYYRNLRMNYYAVTALLARAALYFGDKDLAKESAEEVIRAVGTIFSFVGRGDVIGTDNIDRIFSPEVIFALTNTQRNKLFKNYYDPGRRPNYVFTMDRELMEKRIYGGGLATGGSQEDLRYKANWESSGTNMYFHKYADMNDTGNIRNTMIPLIGIGEMYLICAECGASLSDGLAVVNKLRSNRNVNALSGLTSDLLKNEYVRELYGMGQLFFMYKRMFSPILFFASESKNPVPSDEIFVVPLPDSETQN